MIHDEACQRQPLHHLHREEYLSIVFAKLIDINDVRVPEAAAHARLFDQVATRVLAPALSEAVAENFEGDGLPEACRSHEICPIHASRATFTKQAKQLVATPTNRERNHRVVCQRGLPRRSLQNATAGLPWLDRPCICRPSLALSGRCIDAGPRVVVRTDEFGGDGNGFVH